MLGEPTYGDLIKLLEEAESAGGPTAEALVVKFSSWFPHIPISRSNRFLDTIRRIAAPTRPSTVGGAKLEGSPLRSYLKRHWAPRIRNAPGITDRPHHVLNLH